MPTAARQLEQKMNVIRYRLNKYRNDVWPRKAGIKTLEWIDGNFRAQGYRDNVLIPWKRTKSGKKVKFGQRSQILQESGRLRRGNKMQPRREYVRIYNNTPWARVHNEGFNGTQQVRAHNRRKRLYGEMEGPNGKMYSYGARMSIRSRKRVKNAKVTYDTKVRAFTRRMKIPRRQFMPSAQRGSKMLNTELYDMTNKGLQTILMSKKL